MQTLIPIIIFILILSFVIFIHEMGHFLAARRAGIFVEEFALGMGPKIFSFRGKGPRRNDAAAESGAADSAADERTLYSLRAFPIGGFCRMRGMDEAVADDPQAMNNKSVGARMSVILGGSVMNFAAAFVLFFALVMLRGYPVAEVMGLVDGMPGAQAGLAVGDRITHVNGSRVRLYDNFMFMLDTSGGHEMEVRVSRDGASHTLYITPQASPYGWRIGFYNGRRHGLLHRVPEGSDFVLNRVGVVDSLIAGADMIVFHIRTPFRLLTRLATRSPMPEQAGVMGPIGMAGAITSVYQEVILYGVLDTLLTMLFLAGLLSAALGIMNLLPIPALDGARMIFLIIEAIRKKPVPPERESMVHVVGFVVLIALAVFIAYRDIINLLA